MYLHREIYTITRGRAAEFERRVIEMHTMTAQQPGAIAVYLLRSLGNDMRYLSLRVWERREDAHAWREHAWFQSYLQSRPPGLYAWPPQIEYLEGINSTPGQGQPGFALIAYGDALGGKSPELERTLARQVETVCGQPGFVQHYIARSLGNTTRYFWASFWSSRATFELAFEKAVEIPGVQPLQELMAVPPVEEFYVPIDHR